MIMHEKISEQQKQILQKLNTRKNILSGLRIVLLLGSVYFFYLMMYERQEKYAYVSVCLFLCFIVVVNFYLKLQSKVKYHQALKQIHDREISFLKGEFTFDAGKEFLNPQHPYSYDLDLFGENSIFQYINRTNTSLGKTQLAKDLQNIPDAFAIKERQKAVKELTQKVDFSQKFQALSLLANTSVKEDDAIQNWTEMERKHPHAVVRLCAYIFPVLFVASFIGSFVSENELFSKFSLLFFTLNMINVGFITSFITKEIGKSDKISETIQHYSQMIQVFQNENFESPYLIHIQNQLLENEQSASQSLKELSQYFEKLNTIANLFIFIAFNGIFQYHFWVYHQLVQWKSKHQAQVWSWIQQIGKIEALISLSNYANNHPNYIFAEVSDEEIVFENLGHPLLTETKRVRNSIDFTDFEFVILTGSNMSGKSTFLRTIGMNLVLSYSGAPIDATVAIITPMPLWVSMRLTDSLSDSESYFFAEVKRLQQIVLDAQERPIFVLLDEILKGTNSDDKKTGTVTVIEKLHHLRVKGVMATHDLEVCEIANRYPEAIANKRFEVEIINNELHFDYLLKEGVCQNKNATFIMRKMGII